MRHAKWLSNPIRLTALAVLFNPGDVTHAQSPPERSIDYVQSSPTCYFVLLPDTILFILQLIILARLLVSMIIGLFF